MKETAPLLSASADSLSLIESTAQCGIWEYDLDTLELRFSLGLYALFDLDPEKDIPDPFDRRFFTDETMAQITEVTEKLFNRGMPYDISYPLITAKGRTLFCRSVARLRTRADGGKTAYGVIYDLGILPARDPRIVREKNISARFLQHSPNLMWVKDLKGRHLIVGTAFADAIGREVKDVLMKTDSDLFGSHGSVENFGHSDTEVFQKNRPTTFEESFAGPDGEKRVFLTTKFPIPDETLRIFAIGGISTDITDRKKVEEDLILVREQALVASRTKSEFLANMSHELRTPMNAVLGMADLLLESTLTHEQRILVDTLKRSSEGLVRILNDILDLSKIETGGKMELVDEVASLSTLLNTSVDLFRMRALEKGVDLELHMQANSPDRVRIDATRMRQMIWNLLGNAVKFTAAGKIRVEANFSEETEAGFQFRLTVSDTGIGLPADAVEKVFERFSQADPSITRKFGGSGLGLHIVRTIARRMGGDVSARRLEIGTAFDLVIPVRKAMGKDRSIPSPHVRDFSETLPKNLRILLVDDHEENRLLIRHYLKDSTHLLEIAENGEVAVQLVCDEERPYDVILMDIQMPVMDGYAATRKIRAWEKNRNSEKRLPVLALTAHALVEDAAKTREAGCDAHLTKPIRKADLLAGIAEAISAKASSVETV